MGNEKASRAKQFMPFAALRGYYDMVRACERVREPRRIRSEEELDRLSAILASLSRGDMLRVTFYHTDAYETMEGMVAGVDPIGRTLTVVKTKINFADIFELVVL